MSRGARLAAVTAASLAVAAVVLLLVEPVARRDTWALGASGLALLAPSSLRLLAMLPLLVPAELISLVDLARAERAMALAARALLLVTLALALARPAWRVERDDRCTVALLDVSRSIDAAERREEVAFLDELRRGAPGDAQPLVLFGGRARASLLPRGGEPVSLPTTDEAGEAWEPAESDLQAALRLSWGLCPPDVVARAVLLSDGEETRGDVIAEAAEAERHGFRLDVHPLVAAPRDDLRVVSIKAPDEVKLHEPFAVEVEVWASRAAAATLRLRRNGLDDPGEPPRPVTLAAGANRIRLRSRADEAGVALYEAVVGEARAVEGAPFADVFSDNDRAATAVVVKGRPRVLYVEGDPAADAPLAKLLEAQHLEVDARTPAGAPSTAAELARYDLVLLSDVAASALGPARMAALDGYVREGGGGLLVGGGQNVNGAGNYAGSALEKLLPVRFDIEQKKEEPRLALALAIDRSGSMQGEKLELAKEAAKASVELLKPDDLVAVIAFDALAQPLVHLQPAASRARVLDGISRLQAGGGTNLLAPLKEALEQLLPARAAVRHVILLTDGQADYTGILDVCDDLAREKITVSAVGVGSGADKVLLAMIAQRGGGRFYFTEDPQSVPQIFARDTTEAARTPLVEDKTRVHAVGAAELLAGIDLAAAPALGGYVASRAKPTSEVLLASDRAEPLLARWRLGLGQTAMWTSDVKNRWASDWLRWSPGARLLLQLVRATMRPQPASVEGSGATSRLSLSVDSPRVRVTADVSDADDRFVDGLDTTLELVDPAAPATLSAKGSAPVRVALAQTGPGRYEGELRVARHGGYVLRVTHRSAAGALVATATAPLSMPYPRELSPGGAGALTLARAAALGGGRVVAHGAEVGAGDARRVPARREARTPLLWAAVALLCLDVLVRRVRLVRA